jgi:hypothetical protein
LLYFPVKQALNPVAVKARPVIGEPARGPDQNLKATLATKFTGFCGLIDQ